MLRFKQRLSISAIAVAMALLYSLSSWAETIVMPPCEYIPWRDQFPNRSPFFFVGLVPQEWADAMDLLLYETVGKKVRNRRPGDWNVFRQWARKTREVWHYDSAGNIIYHRLYEYYWNVRDGWKTITYWNRDDPLDVPDVVGPTWATRLWNHDTCGKENAGSWTYAYDGSKSHYIQTASTQIRMVANYTPVVPTEVGVTYTGEEWYVWDPLDDFPTTAWVLTFLWVYPPLAGYIDVTPSKNIPPQFSLVGFVVDTGPMSCDSCPIPRNQNIALLQNHKSGYEN